MAAARHPVRPAASASLPPRRRRSSGPSAPATRPQIDAATRERFARSGLAHVLSVSGLHLAVVAFGAWRALQAALLRVPLLASRFDVRRAAAAAGLPVTALYALATGATVPVLRSAVAAGLAFARRPLGRRADAAGALAIAALALLAFDPGCLVDVSFQLSFVSVTGLVALSRPSPGGAPLPSRPAAPAGPGARGCPAGACASAAATIATAPLLALHFRSLSTVAIPANAVALPVASALTVLAALAYLASAVAARSCPRCLWACRPLAAAFLRVNEAFAAPASPRWASRRRDGACVAARLRRRDRARSSPAGGARLAPRRGRLPGAPPPRARPAAPRPAPARASR